MQMLSISTENVKVPVAASLTPGTPYNPTGDNVYMAFGTKPSAPAPGTGWNTASWQTVNQTYYAVCLVGPNGGVSLTPGSYQIWVQVTDSPEVPVKQGGTLTIT